MIFKNIITTFILILSITNVNFLLAQDLSADLSKVRKTYNEMENYHGEIFTKSFNASNPSKAIEKQKMAIRKKGGNFLYQVGDVEFICNNKYTLTANLNSKVVVCQKTAPQFANRMELLPDVDSLLNKYKKIEFVGVKKGKKHYVLKNPRELISSVEIYIDSNSYLFSKLIYHYNPQMNYAFQKSIIELKHLNTSPQFPSDLFSEKNYVSIEKGKVKLKTKFQKYDLVLGEGLEYWEKN